MNVPAGDTPIFNDNHLNQGLFSDYYLDTIVPTLPEWQDTHLHSQARQIRDDLRALFVTLEPENLSEAQLEERWIKPVLEKLGHYFAVQVKIAYRGGHRQPDYVFAANSTDVATFTKEIHTPQDIAHAIALGDAKRWGVHLDQSGGRQGRNPSQQIDKYLPYSELD